MAKRFIDTGLFDDDWFMELSKDCKILWLYFLTKCDHAGMLKMNEKLCRVQTDIKDLQEIIKQLGNRIITVSERLYFIPKFLQYQYPGFPESKAKAQLSAIDILTKYGLFKEGNLTVTELLPNSYGKGKDYNNSKGNDKSKKQDFDFSFVEEVWKSLFEEWLAYKKSRNEHYKTQQSIEACYRNLKTLSRNDVAIGRRVLDKSMGNNYQGLVPVDDKGVGTTDVEFEKQMEKLKTDLYGERHL